MPRLRSLSEAECYTRIYGRDGEPLVTIVSRSVSPLHRLGVSGEDLRRLFEDRLDSRDPDGMGEAAA